MEWLKQSYLPYEIGGRSLEIEQIVASIEYDLKTAYPINAVPDHLMQQLRVASANASIFEHVLRRLLTDAQNDYKYFLERQR